MKKKKTRKATLVLAGAGDGTPPTFEDLIAFFRKLTGREPTAEDLATSRTLLDDHLATLKATR